MLRKLLKFIVYHKYIFVICFILSFIPFFWFKPGYIDIGGDSSRLYFYDPIGFLKSFTLNTFEPDSLGIKSNGIYTLPFVSFLAVLHFIFKDPWFVNCIFYSLSLVLAFLSIYAITSDLLKKFGGGKVLNKSKNLEFSSILAGLFYTLIPISSMAGWDLPLIIHTQRFVYPLIFLFLLRYINSSKLYNLLLAILISGIFAQNFSWVNLPNMLSFFFFGFLFLILCISFEKKFKITKSHIVLSFFLFLGIQSFQYVPLVFGLFSKNNALSNQLLQGNVLEDILRNVEAVANYTQRGYQFFGAIPFSDLNLYNASLIIFPALILFMLIRNKNIKIIIPMSFFMVLYWLNTAKITKFGLNLYEKMFYIPGFVMYRNFYGRFLDIFLLFFAFLVAYSFFSLPGSFKSKAKIVFFYILTAILVINSWVFIKGDISNRILTKDTGLVIKSHFKLDPKLDQLLKYYKGESATGRNLSFPIADFGYQIIASKNHNGAYFGPSIIANLTGVSDISSNFSLRPFAQGFFESVKNKDFQTASNIFPLLSINSVMYDSDPYIYEAFATFPYNDVKLYFPKTQKGLAQLIKNFPLQNNKQFGRFYTIYTVDKKFQLPMIYVADQIRRIDSKQASSSNYDEKTNKEATYVLTHFRDNSNDYDLNKVFLSEKLNTSLFISPQISFKKVNSSKYIIHVKNAKGPYILVFSSSFNDNWRLFKEAPGIFNFSEENSIAINRHYLANAYANAWYILPQDVSSKNEYTLTLVLNDQKFIYIGFIISGFTLFLLLVLLIKEILNLKIRYGR